MLKHWILVKGKIKEVDLLTWAKWFGSSADRIIGNDVVKNVRISTVFLGLDHRFSYTNKKQKPILFETMMFNIKKKKVTLMGREITAPRTIKHSALIVRSFKLYLLYSRHHITSS